MYSPSRCRGISHWGQRLARRCTNAEPQQGQRYTLGALLVMVRTSISCSETSPQNNLAHQECLMPHEPVKKLRYMSKFVAIFAGADNTQLMRTQPIANLVTVCLQVFPALLLTSLTQCKFLSDSAIVLFRY